MVTVNAKEIKLMEGKSHVGGLELSNNRATMNQPSSQ